MAPARCVFCGQPTSETDATVGRPPHTAHVACADAALADDAHWDAVAAASGSQEQEQKQEEQQRAEPESGPGSSRPRGAGCATIAVSAFVLALASLVGATKRALTRR